MELESRGWSSHYWFGLSGPSTQRQGRHSWKAAVKELNWSRELRVEDGEK